MKNVCGYLISETKIVDIEKESGLPIYETIKRNCKLKPQKSGFCAIHSRLIHGYEFTDIDLLPTRPQQALYHADIFSYADMQNKIDEKGLDALKEIGGLGLESIYDVMKWLNEHYRSRLQQPVEIRTEQKLARAKKIIGGLQNQINLAKTPVPSKLHRQMQDFLDE